MTASTVTPTLATPIALTIAGSDSGGGAGIQADLKAFSALGVFGASVITAVTAQNTREVTAVHAVPVDIVSAQIEAVLSDLAVGAIKIGMLFSPELILVVADRLAKQKIPVVLDPVMVAKSGDRLLLDASVAALIDRALPLADVLTPNLPEAAILLGTRGATTIDDMEKQGRALLALGPKAVLMKGGHAEGERCVDLLITGNQPTQLFEAPRISTKNTHGTGCTLSSSIVAGLAKGLPLAEAVSEAHAFLHKAIVAADQLNIGSGHGPVHHFHEFWAGK